MFWFVVVYVCDFLRNLYLELFSVYELLNRLCVAACSVQCYISSIVIFLFCAWGPYFLCRRFFNNAFMRFYRFHAENSTYWKKTKRHCAPFKERIKVVPKKIKLKGKCSDMREYFNSGYVCNGFSKAMVESSEQIFIRSVLQHIHIKSCRNSA